MRVRASQFVAAVVSGFRQAGDFMRAVRLFGRGARVVPSQGASLHPIVHPFENQKHACALAPETLWFARSPLSLGNGHHLHETTITIVNLETDDGTSPMPSGKVCYCVSGLTR